MEGNVSISPQEDFTQGQRGQCRRKTLSHLCTWVSGSAGCEAEQVRDLTISTSTLHHCLYNALCHFSSPPLTSSCRELVVLSRGVLVPGQNHHITVLSPVSTAPLCLPSSPAPPPRIESRDSVKSGPRAHTTGQAPPTLSGPVTRPQEWHSSCLSAAASRQCTLPPHLLGAPVEVRHPSGSRRLSLRRATIRMRRPRHWATAGCNLFRGSPHPRWGTSSELQR